MSSEPADPECRPAQSTKAEGSERPERADHPSPTLADIRNDYCRDRLRRANLLADPLEQFRVWLQTAIDEKIQEPTAMSLATAAADGRPLLRTVLLKGLDERGFVFYTNLESRKARHLTENPQAALLFPWLQLERQVIVRGSVERVTEAESEAYFTSRPRESRLAAWASAQSRPISSRAALEEELDKITQRFTAETDGIPLPPFWGGYRVLPETLEFWQGGSARLHDRFEYTLEPDGLWSLQRLSP